MGESAHNVGHPRYWVSMPWPRVDHGEGCKMELPPSLGLGTINIVSFVERLIFTKARVQSLGMGMGRCQAPTLPRTHRLTSIHYVPSLDLIKGIFNTLFKLTHSHTHTHTHTH